MFGLVPPRTPVLLAVRVCVCWLLQAIFILTILGWRVANGASVLCWLLTILGWRVASGASVLCWLLEVGVLQTVRVCCVGC